MVLIFDNFWAPGAKGLLLGKGTPGFVERQWGYSVGRGGEADARAGMQMRGSQRAQACATRFIEALSSFPSRTSSHSGAPAPTTTLLCLPGGHLDKGQPGFHPVLARRQAVAEAAGEAVN